MTTKKGNNKPGIDIHNEAERINIEIDRLITNPKDRETLKEFFKSNYLLTQFFFRSETDRDIDIEERVIGIVMKKMQQVYLADNESLCENVTTNVIKELEKYLSPWNVRLDKIDTNLENLKTGQEEISGKIGEMVKRVEHLETFEEKAAKEIDYLKKTQNWKSIAIRILLAVLISTIVTLVSLMIHNNKTKKLNGTKPQVEVIR